MRKHHEELQSIPLLVSSGPTIIALIAGGYATAITWLALKKGKK